MLLRLDDLKGSLLKTEMETECNKMYQYLPEWTRVTPEYTEIITEWTGTIRFIFLVTPVHSRVSPVTPPLQKKSMASTTVSNGLFLQSPT